MPRERLVELAFGCPLEVPGHLGEQVTPAVGQFAEFGDRGGFFFPGERAPPGVMPRLAGQLGDEQTVGSGSGMILVHLARIEYGYAKGKVNSRNRVRPIQRVLKCRHPGLPSGKWIPA